MSTRAVIARTTGPEGEFKGVYSHWDGYPTNLGKRLWKIIQTNYHGDLVAALRYLIDAHSAGWSVPGKECYCHPKRKRDAAPLGNWFTHENVESDIEWVYIFDEENNRMFIRDTGHDSEMIVELGEAEPDWLELQCGKELERCSHMVWVHFPEMKGSNLSTQTYLGKRPFEMHDAVAFIVNGKRFGATGSGGNSDYLNNCAYRTARRGYKVFPRNSWIATVKAVNGRMLELPVASIKDGKYVPLPGITWVYPPTKNNPEETVVV